MKIFLMFLEDLSISTTDKVGNQQLVGAVQFCFRGFNFLADAVSHLKLTPRDMYFVNYQIILYS